MKAQFFSVTKLKSNNPLVGYNKIGETASDMKQN